MKKWITAILMLAVCVTTACGMENKTDSDTGSPSPTATETPAPNLPDNRENAEQKEKEDAENIGEEIKKDIRDTGDSIQHAGEEIMDDMTGENQ